MLWVWAGLLFVVYTAAVFAAGVLAVLLWFRRDWERQRRERIEAISAEIDEWTAGLDPDKWRLLTTTERLLTTDGDAYVEATRASGS